MSSIANSEHENDLGLKRMLIRDALHKDLKKERVKKFNLKIIGSSSCH